MRTRVVPVIAVLVAALLVAVGLASSGEAAPLPASGAGALPASGGKAGPARPGQVVTVRAASPHSTVAVLEVWARTPTGYTRVAGPWQARVGWNGIGRVHEGSGRTPAGVWPLGTGFGVGTRDPGSHLGWFTAGPRDWWGSDVRSPSTYNRHVRCRRTSCPFRTAHAEHLVDHSRAYRYAMLIGYNSPPHVRDGAGSAFFLHVGTGGPTAGCVSLPASQVVWLLRRMKPGGVVSIGVGPAAYAPLHA